MDLKSNISKLCNKKGITLKKLALLINISEQTLHKNFRRGSMETKYLEKMAKVFGISPGEILDLNYEPNIIHDPEVKFESPEKEKNYTDLLEELRVVSREHRETCKRVIDLEEELRKLKLEKNGINQKSTVIE